MTVFCREAVPPRTRSPRRKQGRGQFILGLQYLPWSVIHQTPQYSLLSSQIQPLLFILRIASLVQTTKIGLGYYHKPWASHPSTPMSCPHPNLNTSLPGLILPWSLLIYRSTLEWLLGPSFQVGHAELLASAFYLTSEYSSTLLPSSVIFGFLCLSLQCLTPRNRIFATPTVSAGSGKV